MECLLQSLHQNFVTYSSSSITLSLWPIPLPWHHINNSAIKSAPAKLAAIINFNMCTELMTENFRSSWYRSEEPWHQRRQSQSYLGSNWKIYEFSEKKENTIYVLLFTEIKWKIWGELFVKFTNRNFGLSKVKHIWSASWAIKPAEFLKQVWLCDFEALWKAMVKPVILCKI